MSSAYSEFPFRNQVHHSQRPYSICGPVIDMTIIIVRGLSSVFPLPESAIVRVDYLLISDSLLLAGAIV